MVFLRKDMELKPFSLSAKIAVVKVIFKAVRLVELVRWTEYVLLTMKRAESCSTKIISDVTFSQRL